MSYINKIIQGDCRDIIKNIESDSVHLILSDIPYGINIEDWDILYNNTNSALLKSSPAQKKIKSVFKRRGKPLNGWSKSDHDIPMSYYKWCLTWTKDWLRVLKPGGSAIVFSGRRFVHRCICAFEDTGFIYKDMLSWLKRRSFHRAQRLSAIYERRKDIDSAKKWAGWKVGNLRPVFEPILWFIKPYKIGDSLANNILKNEIGAYNEKAFIKYNGHPDNVINITDNSNTKRHSTQKPLKLMQAFIELTTLKGQTVLDPFCGSGTTIIAAYILERNYIGIELDKNYYNIAANRLYKLQQEYNNSLFSPI